MKRFDYENKEYLSKLEELPQEYYSKYVAYFQKYLKKDLKFLDVGCGNGEVLSQLKENGFINGYGLDVSKLFVKNAKSRGLKNVFYYDGNNFPFKNNFFDLIGSFNVLEHTQNPKKFIAEQVKILKPGGYIVVACPNFLSSVLISPHPKVNGVKRKILNFLLVIKKIMDNNSTFSSMPVIKRKHFQYDDDAITVTNLIDLKRVLESSNCKIIYESGFINYNSAFFKLLNLVPVVRYSLPSCFVVAQKR